jgi:RNase H-fold protein (predicted Holliday junction resolvase)
VKNKTLASKLDTDEVVKNYGSLIHRKQMLHNLIQEENKKINQITEQVKNKYVSESKTKKVVESISALQDQERYQKNLNSNIH